MKVNREFSAKVKTRVRHATGGRCEFPDCRRQGTQYHHRLMKSQGGLGTFENCMLVCLDHHAYIHANPAESYGEGWLIRSGLAATG